MISTWRRRRADRRARKEQRMEDSVAGDLEIMIPNNFRCPISLDLMKDPVTLSTGITYDRESIERWMEAGNYKCPITNQILHSLESIPNHSIRIMIQNWCVDNKSRGVDRIPTPRIPITSGDVSDLLTKIMVSCGEEDRIRCRDLVTKAKILIKESERNKALFLANKTGHVLSAAYQTFSKSESCFANNVAVLEEILSVLTLIFPLDDEAKSCFGLDCLIWFMKGGDLSARRNAILVIKELFSDKEKVDEFVKIEGVAEVIFKLIKEPICPSTTKALLIIVFHIVSSASSSSRIMAEFGEMGLISVLLEILVDAEKSVCEKALGVLDGICRSKEGRLEAYNHALIMPVIVKKILRVSDLATNFSVSIIWNLSKNEGNENETELVRVLVDALQVGAFQKLLLLLQVGCAEKTKLKATELLKLMNLHRKNLECIESIDFKDLKRPF